MKNKFLIVALTAFFSGSVMAQAIPYNVQDLVGARASSGDSQLRSRGYSFVKTTTGGDVKWANWWNNGNRTCITVATVNGAFDSIISGPAEDCNRSSSSGNNSGWNNGGWNNNNSGNNGNWGWGSGQPNNVSGLGKAGVTVYDDRNFRGTSQSFGVGRYLNNARQFGALRNDEASSVVVLNGYKVRFCEGEGSGSGSGKCEELGAGSYNLRLNDEVSFIEVSRAYGGSNWGNSNNGNWNGGGNWAGSPAEINDLSGLGTFSGNARLISRGFRLVDTMRQGSTSYSIWWRSNSSQCVQVTIASGRYQSVNDIGSHPRCR